MSYPLGPLRQILLHKRMSAVQSITEVIGEHPNTRD
jgi:hypothetical protein